MFTFYQTLAAYRPSHRIGLPPARTKITLHFIPPVQCQTSLPVHINILSSVVLVTFKHQLFILVCDAINLAVARFKTVVDAITGWMSHENPTARMLGTFTDSFCNFQKFVTEQLPRWSFVKRIMVDKKGITIVYFYKLKYLLDP